METEKVEYSKFIVLLIIVLNIIFTAGIFYIVYLGIPEPSTLIITWFSFTTVELLAVAGIKITEKRCDRQQHHYQPEFVFPNDPQYPQNPQEPGGK